MREIKFRVWDKECKRMLDWMYPVDCWMRWLNGEDNKVVIMQYTEGRDKNGKEIYEGDVVRFQFLFPPEGIEIAIYKKGIIVYENYSFCVELPPLDGMMQVENIAQYADDIEVIGNVWENPKLLDLNPNP